MKKQMGFYVLVTMFVFTGCGGSSGGGSGSNNGGVMPTISGLSFSPTTARVDDNGGQVNVSATIDFSDPDGDLRSATINVLDAAGTTVTSQATTIANVDGVISGTIQATVTASTSTVGDFTVQVFVTDARALQSNSLEGLFSIRSPAWVAGTAMPAPRLKFATAVVDGLIYVIAGRDALAAVTPKTPVSSVQVYDPSDDTWSTSPSLPIPAAGPVAVTVNDKIYVIGGTGQGGIGGDSVFEFDPATQLWTTKTSMPEVRTDTAIATHGGLIYVAGGGNAGFTSSSLFRYDPTTDAWTAGSPMSEPREGASAAVIGGQVLVYGGSTTAHVPDAGYRRVLERYDPIMDAWIEREPGQPRRDMGVTVLNEIMYAFGGSNVSRTLNTARSFDDASNSWSVEVQLPVAQGYNRAEAVNGKIYIIGTVDTLEFTP
jgi:N-acetylneuraminic acid mutarotase